MSDIKHSPGPWIFGRNSTHSGGIATIHHCQGNDWVEIWTDTWCEFYLDEARQEANARLICAAPDLLAELEETHAALCFTPDYIGTERHKRNAAAITKARGES